MRSNIEHFQKAMDFCEERRFGFGFQPMCMRVFNSPHGDCLALDHMLESLLFYPEEWQKWHAQFKTSTASDGRLRHQSVSQCDAHNQHLIMMADGRTMLCFNLQLTHESDLDVLLETGKTTEELSSQALLETLSGVFSANKIVRSAQNGKAKLLVWGTAGGYKDNWKSFVETNPCIFDLLGFVDSDSEKWGTTLSGLPVHSPDTLEELQPGVIIIASCHVDEIKNEIERLYSRSAETEILHRCSGNEFERFAKRGGI